MRTRNQILADFYLDLLAIPVDDKFRMRHNNLYNAARQALAYELNISTETVRSIFEAMASEDRK